MTDKPKRGFAAMSPDKQRELAARGGSAVPAENRTFSRNRDLAAAAGRAGGNNVPPALRTFSKDNKLAMRAGRAGGNAAQARRRAKLAALE
mgnify:CR=1 FL=1